MTPSTPARTGFRITNTEEVIPAYAHPPLMEAWLKVDFDAETESFIQKAGSLRSLLGPEWSGNWQETPAADIFGGLQLTHVMGDRTLRMTETGFAYGWLGYTGERYPRYESVRDGFVSVLSTIQRLNAKGVAPQVPTHWTVHYANRIPQGTVWAAVEDWSFFALWRPEPWKSIGMSAIGTQAQWELPLDAERGKLIVDFRHDTSSSAAIGECVWICLTALGPIEDGETSMFDCFDYGREVIVRTFNGLVSSAAKSYWGAPVKQR